MVRVVIPIRGSTALHVVMLLWNFTLVSIISRRRDHERRLRGHDRPSSSRGSMSVVWNVRTLPRLFSADVIP